MYILEINSLIIFSRGLKDPDGARRRMEAKSAAAAAMEGRQDSREGGMKWQVG